MVSLLNYVELTIWCIVGHVPHYIMYHDPAVIWTGVFLHLVDRDELSRAHGLLDGKHETRMSTSPRTVREQERSSDAIL